LTQRAARPGTSAAWNERGAWLVKEKEKRNADVIDVDWLAEYKPAKKGKKKSAVAQAQGETVKKN
jgi:hypothetical protein